MIKEKDLRRIILLLIAVFAALILFAMFGEMDETSLEPISNNNFYSELAYTNEINNPVAAYDISFSQGCRLLVLGIFSGMIGGMMGMGGGVVKTSGLMLIFGVEVLLARAVSLITNVFIYGTAAYKYSENKKVIIKKVAELMIPGAILGVGLGFLLGNILHTDLLKKMLGLFALFSCFDMLRRVYFVKDAGKQEPTEYTEGQFKKENKTRIAGAGFPMGMVMGLFGISGGVIGVPYQRFILNIPMKNAIANTTITSFIASLFALVLVLWYECAFGTYSIMTPLFMAACIVPGNILGARIGASLTGSLLPVKFINILYIVLMFIIGIKLFF